MLASELIQQLQMSINAVGDSEIYVCAPPPNGSVIGYMKMKVGIDVHDLIVIDLDTVDIWGYNDIN